MSNTSDGSLILLEQYIHFSLYNQWMNRRLIAACKKLTVQQLAEDKGAYFKSIIGTLNHLLITDKAWLFRVTQKKEEFLFFDIDGQKKKVNSVGDIVYSSLSEFERHRELTDERILQFIKSLTTEKLAAPLTYKSLAGPMRTHTHWRAISHWFNHQTHHRGQISTLVMQSGIDIGATDFIIMLEEQDSLK